MLTFLVINFVNLIVTLLVILIIAAIVIGILYLFEKYVSPIGQPLKGIIIFIVVALLIIYAITNGGIALW